MAAKTAVVTGAPPRLPPPPPPLDLFCPSHLHCPPTKPEQERHGRTALGGPAPAPLYGQATVCWALIG